MRLDSGEVIETATFVWTAENRPNPPPVSLPGERGRGGPVAVDRMLRAFGQDGVWAIGDCARFSAEGGTTCPPTAQHAMREGTAVADNIAAVLRGHRPRPFRFTTLGTFVALGHRTAAGEVRVRPFSGRGYDLVSGLGWGLSYGFFWWVFGGLTLMPAVLGVPLWWTAPMISADFASLVGHLAYGGGLGAVHAWLEHRENPWWLARSDVEEARAIARREQVLGSAPALWMLTVLIALTVPVLVA